MNVRLRSWIQRALAGLVTLYLAYLAIANVFLGTGALERILTRRPVKFQIGWQRAWTLTPGRVEVRGFWMKGQTRSAQWMAEVDRGRLRMPVLPLCIKRFVAEEIATSGVRFRLRRQRIPGEALPRGAAFEPEIPGMPETRPPLDQLLPRPRKPRPWHLDFRSINVSDLQEMWVTGYRMSGSGRAAGQLSFSVGGPLEIRSLEIELPQAEVHSGERPVGENLAARLELTMPGQVVSGRRIVELLPAMSGRLELAGRMADFGFLNLYFSHLPSLELRGAGELRTVVELAEGHLAPSSTLEFDSQRLGVVLRDYDVAGHGTVSMRATGDHRVELEAVVDDIGVAGGGVTVAATASALDVDDAAGGEPGAPCRIMLTASSSIESFANAFADPRVSLRLPRCRLRDMASLNSVLPSTLPVRFLPESEAILEVGLDLTERAGEGELVLSGHRIGAKLSAMPMVGDVSVELGLVAVNPQKLDFDISGSRLEIRSLSYGDQELLGASWWAWARLDDAGMTLSEPIAVNADVTVEMADTLPLIAAFAPAGRAQLLARLLDVERPRARARLNLNRERFEIHDLEMQGRGLGRHVLGGDGSDVVLKSARVDLIGGFSGLSVDLDLPETEIPDLALFNEFLPADAGITLDSASTAKVRGALRLEGQRVAGHADLIASGTALWIRDLPVEADVELHIEVPTAQVDEAWIGLAGSRLVLSRASYGAVGSGRDGDWNAAVEVAGGRLALGDSPALDVAVTAEMADTRPIIAAYLPGLRAGLRLEDLLNIEDVTARATLYADRERLQFSDLQLSGRGTVGGHLKGPGFSVRGSSLSLGVERGFRGLNLAVDLPPSRLEDLASFNQYIPEQVGVAFADGADGEIRARLKLDSGVATGEAEVVARGIGLALGDTSLVGDLQVNLNLVAGDLESQHFNLGGSIVRVDQAPPADGGSGDGAWWARLDVARAELDVARPVCLDTSLYFEMGDSKPLVGLVTGDGGNRWLADLLSFSEVVGSMQLSMNEDELMLGELELRGLGRTSDGILGPGLRISASAKDVRLDEGLDGLELTVVLPESELRDLSLFNRYLPAESGFELLPGGKGRISARLELGAHEGAGRFAVSGSGFGLRLGETTMRGDVELDVRLASGDLQLPVFDVAGSRLRFSDMHITGGDGRERTGWFAELLIASGTARVGYPIGLTSRVELMLSDTWPFVAYGQELSRLVRVFRSRLLVANVAGRSNVQVDSRGISFDEIQLEGDGFAAEGRFRLFQGGVDALLFVQLGKLSAAMEGHGDARRFKLLGSRRWYEQRAAEELRSLQ